MGESDWTLYIIAIAWIITIASIYVERSKRKKKETSKIMELDRSSASKASLVMFVPLLVLVAYTTIYIDRNFWVHSILFLAVLTMWIHRYLLKDAIYEEGIVINGKFHKWSKFESFKWDDNTLELENKYGWKMITVKLSKKDEVSEIVAEKIKAQ